MNKAQSKRFNNQKGCGFITDGDCQFNTIKKEIKRYLFMCFGITYVVWGIIAIYSRIKNVNFSEELWMLILYVFGVVCPAVSAMVIQKVYDGRTCKEILKDIFKLPNRKRDWIIGLAIVCVLQFSPYFMQGGKIVGSFINLAFLLPMFLIIGGTEEIGWRGFWLERELQMAGKNRGLIILKIGIVWELWHLPLFFILGTYQQLRTNIGMHTLTTLGMAFVLGGLYIRSRSTVLCMMAHSLANAFSDIIVVQQNWRTMIITIVVSGVFFAMIDSQNKYMKTKKEKC